ncbi:SseB family protein [Micromonospora chaiyaphumensis]|uniref:SseB protein N-terminal domain-containing protein n=1 Tax=Micromonospora chaiyaphumensis TaxID=307119 RepID=A0A1C4VQW6_9ACTN|nr:SseB family protein [Micromonospora chaiyaphumensis]SCE86338.1 SseB protein N-terminal domain-containing protein [Micromonospora chaiyaphumensis]
MTGWKPATEAEVALHDALRAQDQQLYFRILTRVELLLPVSTETPGGQSPAGWGTWTTGGRTHVLAFTSATALRACLGENAGSTRRVPYAELAANWPNHEWWLAVDPGLPIEGYLPAWFVAQLARGDVRLPGRTMGARARLERVESAARAARGAPSAPGRDVPVPGGRVPPGPLPPLRNGRGPADGEPSTVPIPTVPAPSTRATVPDPSTIRPDPSPLRPDPSVLRSGSSTPPPALRPEPASGRPGRPLGRRDPDDARPADPPGTDAGADNLAGWLTDLRRRPDEQDPFAGAGRSAPANGRTAEPAPPPARSFFEPTSGHAPRRSSPLDPPRRSGDRAVPPSRFAGGGGQPFPRRRPLNEPVPEDPTQAFRMDSAGPAPASRPAEPARPFRPAAPPAETTQALPRRHPGDADDPGSDERTQPIPGPGDPAEAEELPPSIAEPVSGPPAPRRGFTPIVIEGTVIESRDLTEPPEPYVVPAVPAAASAMATAAAEGDTSVPWAGPTDPTLSLTVDPPASPAPDRAAAEPSGPGERRVGASGETTVPLFGPSARVATGRADDLRPPPYTPAGSGADTGVPAEEPTAPLPEPPTTPLVPPSSKRNASADSTTSLFAPPSSAPEPTTPLFEPVSPAPEPTTTPFPPAEPATTLFEPSEPRFAPPAQVFPPAEPSAPAAAVDEPTTSVFAPTEPTAPVTGDEPTTSVFAPTSAAGPAPTETPPAGVPSPGDVTASTTAADFVPANEVEEDLLTAAGSGSTDSFLTTLLLARVLLPVAPESAPGSRPGDAGFVWRTEQIDGGTYVVVHTSPERLADRAAGPVETVRVKFVQLIRRWPDASWSFAVNPGTPVGATYPGEQVLALANWAAEVGLGDDPESEPPATAPEPAAEPRPAAPPVDPTRPVTMQKAIAPSQLAYYLERGYDRVSGFVHRAGELAHLRTPAELYEALGLGHPGSPFARDADEIYLLRWPAYRPSLYRIPYGGQNEAAMRAMEGWVIERPPFRGNGFAPGESSDVVAEFKVDSARLPHGAELWRVGADRSERVVAVLDADTLRWVRAGDA